MTSCATPSVTSPAARREPPLLPVAAVPGRRRDLALGDDPARGPDSRIFREVTRTGEAVARLGELAGSTLSAQVAVLHDPDAWWALERGRPALRGARLPRGTRRAHRTLWDAGLTVDFAHPAARGEPLPAGRRTGLVPAVRQDGRESAPLRRRRRHAPRPARERLRRASASTPAWAATRPAPARGTGHPRRGAPAAAAQRADHPVGRDTGHRLERGSAHRGRGDARRRHLRPRDARRETRR